LAAEAAVDREAVEARRAEIRRIVREIEDRKRQARREGDEEQLRQLDAFARKFQNAIRPAGSLDSYSH
jgi:hypothetical protein